MYLHLVNLSWYTEGANKFSTDMKQGKNQNMKVAN